MKNNIDIDTTARNWWRDLSPMDYNDREAVQFIMDALASEISRLYIEIADAKIMSEQGEHVDSEWHRSVVTVHEYAKEKRKQFHRRFEAINRETRETEHAQAQATQERILFALQRVETLLDKLEGK